MLKTAIIIALKRDWWLIVSVVMSTAIVQYWREHHVSFLGLFVSLFAALVVFFSRQSSTRASQATQSSLAFSELRQRLFRTP